MLNLRHKRGLVGEHERWHLDPKQIAIDNEDIGDMNPQEAEWIKERKTYNAEFSAREEYKAKYKPEEIDSWKNGYLKTKDSKGNFKPSYMGLDKNGEAKKLEKMPTKGLQEIKP